ncbi:MAG: dTMP kinase [Chloroflexi bacterium AL-W]|nr:dTMP kinase [Chloroflexi bacterium AL-N1]NOK66139.1 dTMP kinase [Chloroflexi bacterium AL-N10]NOK73020.1 dTMP kinase [Chloroflexi bacterium AL-N5]NOK79917.1 dTMP kinase [Chloroflexi bacterium AL-W]NOK88227.1 dTMP kinase [Chloroflexi bacterium AL-N15]
MSLFITFEGIDGSGKSTQIQMLYEYLQARGYPVIKVREPGGTTISDWIRRILLDLRHTEMATTTETLLFSAARAQLVIETIRPYLFDHGGIVLCDRYADSTYAYQGYGLGRDLAELRMVTAMATGGLQPDITIFLDLRAEEGLERKRVKQQPLRRASLTNSWEIEGPADAVPQGAATQTPEWNRLDARELAYHQRVEMGYRELIAESPERWHIFDARQSIDTLAQQIQIAVEPMIEHVRLLEPET